MHIEFLREYIELAQCLNFTEAARRSSITQSALSKHVAALERAFGTELLDRNRHSVKLTQAGHAFLEEALIMDECWERAHKRVRAMRGRQTLRIGGLLQNSRVLWAISTCVAHRDAGGEAIPCTYNQTDSKLFADLLRDNEADVAFTYRSDASDEIMGNELSALPLFQDPYVAVVDRRHPLGQCDSITMADLNSETLVRMAGPYFAWGWQSVEETCARHGFEPRYRTAIAQPGLDFSLIDLQGDVLILSQSSLIGQLFTRAEGYRCLPVTDADATFSICALYRTDDASDTLRLFLDRLRELPESF